ncbi:H-NS family nucleoid-associated regulatory protein [Burkholderia anthina]|uniref:H-NS histone family protein n=1 Tax=Burkholderia anthina TaxID=179879 RepID=UPI00158B18D2
MLSDSLPELLAQRAEIDAQIAAQRAARHADVLEQIIKLVREYEIDLRVVEMRLSNIESSGTSRRRRVEPRYWDPVTGATWAGRGKRPRWMKGRNPEEFRIKSPHEHANYSAPTDC